MKKILLVIQSSINKNKFINTMPPLGILYISSFLESKGISNDVIDYNISNVDYSIANNYDLICFSVNCGNITNTLSMAKHIKENYNKEIIVGGPQVTNDPNFFIGKKHIDGVIIGEGEHTLYEYIKKRKLVKGLYLKNKNKVIFGGKRELLKDLDSLPFPALDKVDIKKYNLPIKRRKPISTLVTSRGCPYGCIFCFHALGYLFRPRSAKSVIDEIEWQVKNFGVKEICIQDDNISLDLNRAKDIFRGVIKKDIDVSFQLNNGIRADKVDRELLELMKKAKLWLINVSPESGDSESLRLMKKGFDNEAVKRVVKISKDIGFFTFANFMVGFPWETEKHIKNTIDFAVKLDTDMVQFSRVVAFPNTKLYDMCNLNYKIEKDIGLFYNDPNFNISQFNNFEINKLIKKAYRKFYFRPKKVINIFRNLKLTDISSLVKYSIITKSV